MRRTLPPALVVLSVFILVCSGSGLVGSALRLLFAQDTGTLVSLLISVALGGLGVFAAGSTLAGSDEGYSRLVFYGNVYRGVALLFALGGLVAMILGVLGGSELAGYGCIFLASGVISLLWYRVIRSVLRRKDVLDAYGMDLYD